MFAHSFVFSKTNRLIGSGLFEHQSSPVWAKRSVVGHLTRSVTESRTAQLPRSCLQALRVATHGQQVACLMESYLSIEVQTAYFTVSADRAFKSLDTFTPSE